MPVRGVIFDLGGTLLHYREIGSTWEAMEKRGARAAYVRLRESGYEMSPETEAVESAWEYLFEVWSHLDAYVLSELTLRHQLQQVVHRWGLDGLAPELLDQLVVAYIQAIQSIVVPLEGAGDTLRALRSQGLKIGLISNTIWPGSFHRQDMERYHLTPFFDDLIFSSDAGAWKPHREVFQRSLNALHVSPEEAIFVGDSLYFDVWGSQQAGLRGVWIEQEHAWQPAGMNIKPDAAVRELPELLNVLRSWQ